MGIDQHLFLQQLCVLSLEEGKAYLQRSWEEVGDWRQVGEAIRDEARRQENSSVLTALKLSELLIFFGEHVQQELLQARGLIAKGDALKLIGQHQAALECLDRAGEELLRLGDDLAWARSRMSWIISATWLGHADEALHEARHARAIFLRHNDCYWACAVDHNMATIYKQLGKYQEASAIYERLLETLPAIHNEKEELIQRAIAMAQANLALVRVLQGRFEQSRTLLQESRQGFAALGNISAIVKIEVHQAEVDYVEGYYGSALRQYYQARDHMIEHNILKGPMSLAELHLRIADCLVKLNRSEEAAKLARDAVEEYRQAGVPLDIGEALREYAFALVALGRSGEALAALDEAQQLFEQGGLEHYALATRLQRAELLLMSDEYEEAYRQACHVKKFFEARELLVYTLRSGLVIAEALIARATSATPGSEQALLDEAKQLCRQVTTQARRYHVQEQVYRGHHLLGRLALLLGNRKRAARHYQLAIGQIERILDDLVHDLSPAFLRTAWAVYEDKIALHLEEGEAEQALSYLERARSVVLRRYFNKSKEMAQRQDGGPPASTMAVLQVRRELEEWQQSYRKYSALLANDDLFASSDIDQTVLREELKRCEGQLSELFERLQLTELEGRSNVRIQRAPRQMVQQVNSACLRQQLAPQQLLLTYFLVQGQLVIFAATRDGLVTRTRTDATSQLERLLPLLHAHLQPAGWPDQAHPPQQVIRRLLNKLYDLLITPVADLLPAPGGHVTIVPYGPLHTLPFHALYDGSHFLVEDFLISYLPASSMLMRSGEAGRDALQPPLVFGYSGNGQLQRAVEEAKSLEQLLGGRCYLEGEATIARLLQEAQGSSLIHLATHGQSRLDAPNFSSILLHDGQLNALDAFNLNLQGCELVTLSGCETGLSLSGGGDEQLGLGRAFLAAGAASLVMSLWPVEDTATSILMQLFYQRLLEGDSRVEALCTAQRHLLTRSRCDHPAHAHPYFWAAFRLVGDAGPLHHFQSAFHTDVAQATPKNRCMSVCCSRS